MSGRGDDRDRSFEESVGGVKPLPGRDRVRAPDEGPPRRSAAAGPGAPVTPLRVLEDGERLAGLARGVDRAWLARLRAGELPPEAHVDLHGLDAAGARRRLRAALAAAWAAGRRCVLVVHGRGRRSEDGPVLKPALAGWLAEPPWCERVLAWCSARPADGGTGASYVLLRRPRKPARGRGGGGLS